jgi:hypothetical protein
MPADGRKSGPDYPHPKKGERVKCLACNNGLVYGKNGPKACTACKGQGFITAN